MIAKHVILGILLTVTLTHDDFDMHYTQKEIDQAVGEQKIRYNSTLRLRSIKLNRVLYSDEMRYT